MLVFLIFAFFSSCLAQTFQCSFQLSIGTRGYVNGVQYYSYPTGQMLTQYTSSGVSQLYLYNANLGYTDYSGQFIYTWRDGCTACSCTSSLLQTAMPILFNTNHSPQPQNRSPLTLPSPTFDVNGFPLTAQTANETIVYSNCIQNFSMDVFNRSSDCYCSGNIDINLVLDRSSSINNTEAIAEAQFVNDFITRFDLNSVTINITNFHTLSWSGPTITPTFTPGSFQFVNSTESYTCYTKVAQKPGCPLLTMSHPASCCSTGTCISAGITEAGISLAARNNNHTKVIVVLTDGKHNRVLEKTSTSAPILVKGFPLGEVLYVNETVACTDINSITCETVFEADLADSVRIANATQIFAIAVGDAADTNDAQLQIIAQNDPAHKFYVSWSNLSVVIEMIAVDVCPGVVLNCPSDCTGFCTPCGCVPIDGIAGPSRYPPMFLPPFYPDIHSLTGSILTVSETEANGLPLSTVVNDNSASTTTGGSDLSGGQIAGIVVGSVVGFALGLVVASVLVVSIRHRHQSEKV